MTPPRQLKEADHRNAMEPGKRHQLDTREDDDGQAAAFSCDVCGERIGWDGYTVMSWRQTDAVDAWGFCEDCWQLLRETIRVEVHYGPNTPPPEAWTRVRKLRAARVRRWGKVDR